MNDLEKLFVSEVEAIYDGEKQFAQALADMEQHAALAEVKQVFGETARQGSSQIERLDAAFERLGHSPQRKTCHGLRGIIKEGRSLADELAGSPVVDAALLGVAEKAMHFKIAAYGTLCSWGKTLEARSATEPLKQTLGETKQTCGHLARLAEATRATVGGGHDLERLFVRQLRQMLDGEHLLVSALAEVEFYAVSRLLKLAVHYHFWQTKKHVQRLEQVFSRLGETPDRRPCDGLEGIIDDAQVAVMEFLHNSALDAALIACAQRAERYEMAAYQNLGRWGARVGAGPLLPLLQQTLDEETATDEKLSLAAEMLRNPQARRQATAKRSAETAEFLKLATHGE